MYIIPDIQSMHSFIHSCPGIYKERGIVIKKYHQKIRKDLVRDCLPLKKVREKELVACFHSTVPPSFIALLGKKSLFFPFFRPVEGKNFLFSQTHSQLLSSGKEKRRPSFAITLYPYSVPHKLCYAKKSLSSLHIY